MEKNIEKIISDKTIMTLWNIDNNWFYNEKEALEFLKEKNDEYNFLEKEKLQEIMSDDKSFEEILNDLKVFLKNMDKEKPILLRYDYIGEFMNALDVFVKSSLLYNEGNLEIGKIKFLTKKENDEFAIRYFPAMYGEYSWKDSYTFNDFLELDEVCRQFSDIGIEFNNDYYENITEFDDFKVKKVK